MDDSRGRYGVREGNQVHSGRLLEWHSRVAKTGQVTGHEQIEHGLLRANWPNMIERDSPSHATPQLSGSVPT